MIVKAEVATGMGVFSSRQDDERYNYNGEFFHASLHLFAEKKEMCKIVTSRSAAVSDVNNLIPFHRQSNKKIKI